VTEPEHPAIAPAWHSRGYLPHFESADVIQHVTFHLADSMAKEALQQMEEEITLLPPRQRDSERRKKADAWIDAGHGACMLRAPATAGMVQNALLFFDAQRYRLLAWVVMPNHVHTLFQPLGEWTVAKIVASWKKFTARRIPVNAPVNAPGNAPGNANLLIGVFPAAVPRAPVWHREYWDRYIRDEYHLQQATAYIHQNPVKAGLAAKAEDWRWSSAFAQNANQEIGVPKGAPRGVPRWP
jgi:REP element-mobilizing transposase RayT